MAVRRHCAPLLDLPRHAAPDAYLARRAELGPQEVNRRFLTAAGTEVFCVDTGYAPERLTTPAELAAAAGGTAYEIVRLEGVAEAVATRGVEPDAYADEFRAAALEAVGRPGVVAVKSVAAYRTGFDLDPARPSDAEVTVPPPTGSLTVGAWPIRFSYGICCGPPWTWGCRSSCTPGSATATSVCTAWTRPTSRTGCT